MRLQDLRRKFVGDRAFYAMTLAVAVPIMIQNGITNFVSMLDNIMVGQIGTESMSGVAIVNQLMFVFYLCVFGAVSGAGIFGAQFAGKKDYDGLRSTVQFKLLTCTALGLIGMGVFGLFGEKLVSMYLHDGSASGSVEVTLQHGLDYLNVMLWGLLPFALTQVYSSTLRENGQTFIPMLSSICAVLVNLVLNYVFIFGHLGFEPMGVRGAALATVISRFVELAFIAIYSHTHPAACPFVPHLYTRWHITARLVEQIIVKGMPLMLNELMWATGIAILNQCYSTRGLDAVAAVNICTTISSVFNVVFISMGNAVGIIVGQILGTGKMEEARDTDNKLIAFSVAACVVTGILLIAFSTLFPRLYNTTDTVRAISSSLICIVAIFMPLHSFANCTYFTLRSGGKTLITIIFDSGFVWVISVPAAMLLSRFTAISIVPLYACCSALDIFKGVLGYILVRRGDWMNNLVGEENSISKAKE